MAETEMDAREIYSRLDECLAMFAGAKGATEADQAVIELVTRNFDMIQRAMLIMLAENRPQSDLVP
ncbi:hypothetical protein [Rhizobium gallicum]|uniref:hypothetical protein n=1 Tax=Rhizobium gallicum TaxID=56730 RepID=UPI001EF7EE00|nr:hypothetical protein [Rhizobium gallicum]ULJ73594.1 hypothetical protein L2W42_08485 [Rhizobium gallicum]